MHFRVFSTHHCVVQEVWNFHQNEPRINCIEFENSSSLRMAFGAIDISYVHTVRRMQREMHDDCSIPIPGMLVPPLLLLLPMCIVEIVKINMHELLKWMDALTPPHIHSLYETERWRTSSIVVSLAFIHTHRHTMQKYLRSMKNEEKLLLFLFFPFSFVCICRRSYLRQCIILCLATRLLQLITDNNDEQQKMNETRWMPSERMNETSTHPQHVYRIMSWSRLHLHYSI